MIPVKVHNDEVLYPNNVAVTFSLTDLEQLKEMAKKNPRKRIRLCCHNSESDSIHEMVIVHSKSCYVRPHLHLNRKESVYALQGNADLLIFNSDGDVQQVIEMGDINSKKIIYSQVPENTLHTIIIRSDFFIFKEVTAGPFDPMTTRFPHWAPPQNGNNQDINNFIKKLDSICQEFKVV